MKTFPLPLILLATLAGCDRVDGASPRAQAVTPAGPGAAAAGSEAIEQVELAVEDEDDGVLVPPPPTLAKKAAKAEVPAEGAMRPSREVRMEEAEANREQRRDQVASALGLREGQNPDKVLAGPNAGERARSIAENLRASREKSAAIVRKKVMIRQELKRRRRAEERAAGGAGGGSY